MDADSMLRKTLTQFLEGGQAYAPMERILESWPADKRGEAPAGLPYSPWQLLEHIRISQRDILDFCREPDYEERSWPDEYWPDEEDPPSERAWEESVEEVLADREAVRALVEDRDIDPLEQVPQGSGQTYAREAILTAVHNAYHLGQLVVLRRLQNDWKD